jgi:hypothetical protein
MRTRRAIFIVAMISALVGALLIYEHFTENPDAVANSVYSAQTSKLGLKPDSFEQVGSSRTASGHIYTWRSKFNLKAEVGVSISPFDVDFWGRPTVPNCILAREVTVREFGDVCQ